MQRPIYLDYAATTPVDRRVVDKIKCCLDFEGNFGNPASRSHVFGWQAEEAVEAARAQVANLLNADTREIVWTSGATESDNLAIKGVAFAKKSIGKHIVTSSIEHKAVLDTCAWLETQGFELTYVQPNSEGLIELSQIQDAVRGDTILVSLMQVNNELGTLTDSALIGSFCREKGILFHIDAAQSMSRLELNTQQLAVDLMSLSAHKMYGPKGVGALYVRRSTVSELDAQSHGGGQERGMRSGTLATHQIVGLGEAAELIVQEREKDGLQSALLTAKFIKGALAIPGVNVNGSLKQRADGIVNLGFAGVDGESMLIALKDLAVSTGSACTSASLDPSYVLSAMGQDRDSAQSALRFSFGRYTSESDIDKALGDIRNAMRKLVN